MERSTPCLLSSILLRAGASCAPACRRPSNCRHRRAVPTTTTATSCSSARTTRHRDELQAHLQTRKNALLPEPGDAAAGRSCIAAPSLGCASDVPLFAAIERLSVTTFIPKFIHPKEPVVMAISAQLTCARRAPQAANHDRLRVHGIGKTTSPPRPPVRSSSRPKMVWARLPAPTFRWRARSRT